MTNLSKDKAFAGDQIPAKCAVIEVHVGELRQLFNAIDPSPFRDRDLDPKAEEFIVGWAKDLPRDAPLEGEIGTVTGSADFQALSPEISKLLARGPKREVYQIL